MNKLKRYISECIIEMMKNKMIQTEIITFFKTNPYPNDEQIHKLAEELNINPHELETNIYAVLSDLLKSKDPEFVQSTKSNITGYPDQKNSAIVLGEKR